MTERFRQDHRIEGTGGKRQKVAIALHQPTVPLPGRGFEHFKREIQANHPVAELPQAPFEFPGSTSDREDPPSPFWELIDNPPAQHRILPAIGLIRALAPTLNPHAAVKV